MADKFPNLPGMTANIQDGNLAPETAPAGPTIAILGTAKKGPSKSQTRIGTAPSALSRFGTSGTLARSAVEAIQGGATNLLLYRILATRGKIEHIGDSAGVDGYTVQTIAEGSTALSGVSVLYNNATDVLKAFDTASGQVVYSNEPDAEVDLGVVEVSGEQVADNAFGSIGLQVKVMDDETAQVFGYDDGNPDLITLAAGANLSLLRFNAVTNTYVAQLLNSAGDVVFETAVTGLDAAARTVDLADPLDAGDFDDAEVDHKIRFVSRLKPIRADKVLINRLPNALAEVYLLLTPGSDFNGLPRSLSDLGWSVSVDDEAGTLTVAEVGPAKMNLFEGMEDGFQALEAAEFTQVLVPGVYLDDPALDGEVEGETALPAEAIVPDSTLTIDEKADRCTLVFADEAAQIAAATALAAAGRGACWIVFTTLQGNDVGDAFGFGHTAGELTRTARVLNWVQDPALSKRLIVFLDRDVSFTVNDDGVVGALAPAVKIYETDQLFYHRSVEVDGQLRHLWYPEASDADGFAYHQVNFAHRLAKFCSDMTENEIAVTGVIGVRPPANHFRPAAIAAWLGKSPVYFEGDVSTNGTGLLGNKFISGFLTTDDTQFDPGFKATENGELDDVNILLDENEFEIDMGKFISVVATWPILSNEIDVTSLGYINSAASLYAGLVASLPPWKGATAKFVGGRGVKLASKLAKRHQNALVGARYIVLDSRPEGIIVVDAPSSALPTSDFTRNMTVRLVSEAVEVCRAAARPFLGDPLSGLRKAALDTALNKKLSDLQRQTGGALESFAMTLTQTRADQIRGTAKLTLTLKVINELRKITIGVALSK